MDAPIDTDANRNESEADNILLNAGSKKPKKVYNPD